MEGSHSGTTAVSDDDHICNVMEPLTERGLRGDIARLRREAASGAA